MLTPAPRLYLRHWWPVAVWLVIILMESSDYASAQNTLGLLYYLFKFLHIRLSWNTMAEVHHFLRKFGHFIGYAILSVLTFFALRNTYRDRIRAFLKRPWGSKLYDLWRSEWVLLAMSLTVVTASLDEMHQTLLPSRTGRWQDVLIDSCGALLAQTVLYLFALWSWQRHRTEVAELTLT